MAEAWIVDGVRTPIGRHGGALASVRPDDLAAVAIKALVQRTGIDSESIDDANRSCLLTDLRWRLTVELENPSTGNLERSVEVDLTVTVIQ